MGMGVGAFLCYSIPSNKQLFLTVHVPVGSCLRKQSIKCWNWWPDLVFGHSFKGLSSRAFPVPWTEVKCLHFSECLNFRKAKREHKSAFIGSHHITTPGGISYPIPSYLALPYREPPSWTLGSVVSIQVISYGCWQRPSMETPECRTKGWSFHPLNGVFFSKKWDWIGKCLVGILTVG